MKFLKYILSGIEAFLKRCEAFSRFSGFLKTFSEKWRLLIISVRLF
jgi:hypothetical protein